MDPAGAVAIAFSSRAGFSTDELAEYAAAAESRGFTSVFVSERSSDAIALAQVMAAATSSIQVGTAITNIHLRHPALAAMAVASADEFSGGRFQLGLGTGHPGYNRAVLGTHLRSPLTAMREYIEILRGAFGDRPVDHRGTVYEVTGFELHRPPLRSDVPIFVGAILPGMLRLAGEIADGAMFALHSPEWAVRSTETVLEAAAEAGREPGSIEISCLIPCAVSDDLDEANAAARGVVAGYALHPSAARLFRSMGFGADLDETMELMRTGDVAGAVEAVPRAIADDLVINGDRASCRTQIAAYRESGVRLPILFPMELGNGGWSGSVANALDLFSSD